LGKKLANRPTKQRLESQGVIKKDMSKHAAVSEALKASQVKDKLNSLYGNRSDRNVLIERGILLDALGTITEDHFGVVPPKKKCKDKLNNFMISRAAESDLRKRGILKSVNEDQIEKKKIDTKASLNHLILARPHRTQLENRGLFRSSSDRKKQFGVRKMSLSTLIATRPDAKSLIDQKILADIGDLPGLNLSKNNQKQLVPKLVDGLKDFKVNSICTGWGHTIVVDDKGLCHIFGTGNNGRLGIGQNHPISQTEPIIIKALQDLGPITKVTAGDHHSAAIVKGKLYTWGSANWGMCGQGSKKDTVIPTEVKLDSAVVDVACGTYHTIILTEGNQVYSCGWNKNGKLGYGKDGPLTALEPTLIKTLSEMKIVSLYAGQQMTIALSFDGKAYSWGKGSFGSCGHGSEDDEWIPKLIKGLDHEFIVKASIGANYALALTKEGKVYSWGQNNSGQLGREAGDEKDDGGPQVILDLNNIQHLCSGNNHSFAIDKDGLLYAWGKGTRGVLGIESEENALEPIVVGHFKDVKIVATTASFGHSGAVTTNGQVYTWGSSQHGKLGYDMD